MSTFNIRVGEGWDVHALEAGRPIVGRRDTVAGGSRLTFHVVHGDETSRVTFSVTESEDEVTASFSQDASAGFHTASTSTPPSRTERSRRDAPSAA